MSLLITEGYRRLNAELHRNPQFGIGSADRPETLRRVASKYGARTVLDYGCGKGLLKRACEPLLQVSEYDPAIEGKDAPPQPADLVACFDVLEHVEPECLDAVLDHIQSLARKAVILVVHTGAAKKVLADGRNAHLTQQRLEWWRPKLELRWRADRTQEGEHGFMFIGVPLA